MRAAVIITKGPKGWEVLAGPDVPAGEQRAMFNGAGSNDKLMLFVDPKMSKAARDEWREQSAPKPQETPKPEAPSPKKVTK